MADFEVKFHQADQRFDLKFTAPHQQFALGYNEVQQVTVREVDNYEGDYDVTPMVTSQTLKTKDKFMLDDVRVKEIPVFNVGNTAGGSTFYIATMDESPDGAVTVLGKAKLGTMVL